MFSGIVEGLGCVLAVTDEARSRTLKIKSPFPLGSTKIGDSISVNGCCLTVTQKTGGAFWADVSRETLSVTTLGLLQKGSAVNLERAMRLGDRIGGHLVQGHVDGVGKILKIVREPQGHEVEVSFPKNLGKFLIHKGSITIDGVSMTLNKVRAKSFHLYVIPHTWKQTRFSRLKVGEKINLEVDLVGKYLHKFLKRKK